MENGTPSLRSSAEQKTPRDKLRTLEGAKDIAITARREPERAIVWLACCDGRRAWLFTAFPSERQKRTRELRKRGTLVGEFHDEH